MIREENKLNIAMAEGDYGIYLPVVVEGAEIDSADAFILTIAQTVQNELDVILSKTFSGAANNTIYIFFTESESNTLPIGQYRYSLDWVRNGSFVCNLIEDKVFSVRNKV